MSAVSSLHTSRKMETLAEDFVYSHSLSALHVLCVLVKSSIYSQMISISFQNFLPVMYEMFISWKDGSLFK